MEAQHAEPNEENATCVLLLHARRATRRRRNRLPTLTSCWDRTQVFIEHRTGPERPTEWETLVVSIAPASFLGISPGTSPRTHGLRSRHESECPQHRLSACGDARPPARRPPSCSPPEHALRRNDTSLVPGPNKGVHSSLPQAFRRCNMDKQLASWPRRDQRCSMGALQWSCVPAAERGFQSPFAQCTVAWALRSRFRVEHMLVLVHHSALRAQWCSRPR